jgi:ABC-type Co2+ transport system permease subunit
LVGLIGEVDSIVFDFLNIEQNKKESISDMHLANAFFFVLFDYELHVAKGGWSILATCS